LGWLRAGGGGVFEGEELPGAERLVVDLGGGFDEVLEVGARSREGELARG